MTDTTQGSPASLPGAGVPDGKSYVDAVNAAGQRSRTLIYFILILTVLTFAAVRNSYEPDWVGQRYKTREEVVSCIIRSDCRDFDDRLIKLGWIPKPPSEAQKNTSWEIQRNNARQRAAKVLGVDWGSLQTAKQNGACTPGCTEPDNWNRRELTLTIEALIKRDIDNDTIALPLLGSVIDINDLWIVSGGLMFFLLYFLRASQKQEERNVGYIRNNMSAFDDLVAMNQVLSPHALDVGPVGKALEWIFGLLPSFLYVYLAALDWCSIDFSYLYIGKTKTYVEYGVEIILIILVVYNNVKCLMNQQNIRTLIEPAYARLMRGGGSAENS